MASSRDRPIIGVLSLIIAALSVFFLSRLSFKVNLNPSFYTILIGTIICSFNVAILFAWIGLGFPGGIAVSIFSVVIVLFLDLRMGLVRYSLFTLPFLATTFYGYRCNRKKFDLNRTHLLSLEKIDEEINVITEKTRQKKRLIFSLEEKMLRYSLLKEVAESLSTELSLEDIDNLLIEKTAKTMGKGGRILLFLVNPERQELTLSASKGISKIKEKKGDIFDHWVLRNRKSLIVENLTKDFRFSADDVHDAKELFTSLIAVPLINEDKVIGILRMDSPHESMYSQYDLRFLDIIASLGAAAIQNAILYSRTQELAIRDGLTGLFVRRYFLTRLDEEINRSARKKGKLSVLMMDIDHFKDYNDKYGHTSGDLVLKHIAKVATSMVREGDIVARYGGEEIVILLSGLDKNEARAEAENIRKAIKEKPLTLRRQDANLTVSIGVAEYPKDAMLEEELIRISDERLYKAKTEGRDRVC